MQNETALGAPKTIHSLFVTAEMESGNKRVLGHYAVGLNRAAPQTSLVGLVTIVCLNCHARLRMSQRTHDDWLASLDGQPLRCGLCTEDGVPMMRADDVQ